MKNRYAIFILTCALAVVLPSCATYHTGYKQYEAQVDTNPSPNAILGAWRKNIDGQEGDKLTWSFLFQKGGKGVSYANDVDGLLGSEDEDVDEFTWKYAGNGVWTSDDMFSAGNHSFRITRDRSRLLWKWTVSFGSSYTVITRQ